ncbi:hypothetical protein [Neomoorella mulderi]|uniref:hypothetical protein n=1 Tax=Neomoorella mulderi TaxID=202604 RepID=UPI000A5B49AF|nr:hypothetical protein [Moorella mulderi]
MGKAFDFLFPSIGRGRYRQVRVLGQIAVKVDRETLAGTNTRDYGLEGTTCGAKVVQE